MKIKIYQIDTFASNVFEGNPAAVVPLEEWLPECTMQYIATENNLSETAFFISKEGRFHIRWFTPTKEVELCGHATLASAYVLFNILAHDKQKLVFDSLSGSLVVTQNDDLLTLDFPSQMPLPCDVPEALSKGLGVEPNVCLSSQDYIAVYDSEEDILAIEPDHTLLQQLNLRGVIVTAPSKYVDFVARFFAPKYGIPEDPVTGSAYTCLTPYWAKVLNKKKLIAKQVSKRGGIIVCEDKRDRVLISGHAVRYMEGSIEF